MKEFKNSLKEYGHYYFNAWLAILVISLAMYWAAILTNTEEQAFPWIMGVVFFFCYRNLVNSARQHKQAHMLKNGLIGWADRLPVTMHVMSEDEEKDERLIVAEFRDGTSSTIALPMSYHPGEDGGMLILEKIFGPEIDQMPEQIREVWGFASNAMAGGD